MNITDDDISTLIAEHSLEIEGGYSILLEAEQDYDSNAIEYFDNGTGDRLGYVDNGVWTTETRRPDWCDGSARKVGHQHRGRQWWFQPSKDIKDKEQIDSMVRLADDLLEYGFIGYVVKLVKKDKYGGYFTFEVTSLWGFPAMEDIQTDYIKDMVNEVIDSLPINIGELV